MPEPVQCQSCGQRYKVQDALAGKRFKCKKCGAGITVPSPAITIQPEAEYRVADLLAEESVSAGAKSSHSAALPPEGSSPNPYASPKAGLTSRVSKYRRYEDVPWYRRSFTNSVFVVVGWLLFPPLLWWCCFNLISGDVYYNKNENGRLKTWSLANKIVAGVFVLLNAAAIIWLATHNGHF